MALITITTDPQLWEVLNTEWESLGYPGFFQCGTKYYQSHQLVDNSIGFKQMDVITDFVDSRSLKVSRKATYRKLETG